jgi:hypothetical protein
MFCQKGKISYEDLVRSLYSVDGTTSNTKKALIRGTNSSYLRNLVISLIKSKDLRLMSLPKDFDREIAILKGLIVKRFYHFSISPFDMSRSLVDKVLPFLVPSLKPNITGYHNPGTINDFDKEMRMTAMQMAFKDILIDILFDHFKRLDADLPLNYLSLSVQELLDYGDKMQRSQEIMQIVDRALAKLDKNKKVETAKSNISVIRDILRMRKFVIKWPHMKYESETTDS